MFFKNILIGCSANIHFNKLIPTSIEAISSSGKTYYVTNTNSLTDPFAGPGPVFTVNIPIVVPSVIDCYIRETNTCSGADSSLSNIKCTASVTAGSTSVATTIEYNQNFDLGISNYYVALYHSTDNIGCSSKVPFVAIDCRSVLTANPVTKRVVLGRSKQFRVDEAIINADSVNCPINSCDMIADNPPPLVVGCQSYDASEKIFNIDTASCGGFDKSMNITYHMTCHSRDQSLTNTDLNLQAKISCKRHAKIISSITTTEFEYTQFEQANNISFDPFSCSPAECCNGMTYNISIKSFTNALISEGNVTTPIFDASSNNVKANIFTGTPQNFTYVVRGFSNYDEESE